VALVATTDGTAVGYVLAVPGEDVVQVVEVAVAPDHRRSGHGTALLAAVTERFDDRETVRLTTRADDERARRFYEVNGFTVVDRLPDHYEDGDGVVFERDV